jgi:dihydrofolate reductase
MGKIVVTEFVSLDGVMEDPGGAEGFKYGGWTFKYDRGDEGNRFKFEELMGAEAQLLGRVTYEGFAAAWPKMNSDEFGKRMNSMPKYVFSNTLTEASWENSTIISGDFAEEISKLKERIDGSILVAGSCRLVQGLIANDLVDELRLMVFPVVLGSGKRLFGETSDSRPLTLKSSVTTGDGVLAQVYERAAS